MLKFKLKITSRKVKLICFSTWLLLAGFYEKYREIYLFSYFKNLLEKYKNIIISPIAKNPNKARLCGLINQKLLDSIAKKLSPIIFKDL